MIEYCLAFVILLTFAVYKYFARNVNYWRVRGVKGPTPLPFFGNSLENFKTPITVLELERSKKYGKIYGYLEMTSPVISISDIELIKLITMKDFHCFPNHENMTPGDPFLSKMMINMEDDEWKRVRNICIPAFTSVRIKKMFPLVNKCVDNAMAYFDGLEKSDDELELKKTFSSYAGDVVASTVFGLEINSMENPDGEYSRHAHSATDMGTMRVVIGSLLPGKLRQLFGFSLFDPSSIQYFKNLMKYVIKERRGKETNHNDLLKILLGAETNDFKKLNEMKEEGDENNEVFDVKHGKKTLDDDELLAQCLLMMLAGTETTSTTLMYSLYSLAMDTRVQNKLYAELKTYFETKSYDYDSLLSLPYLDAFIHETLRRYSPTVHFNRIAKCDYKLADTGITIEKGTLVNLPFHAIHHDPDYYPEPFQFRPERFLPENKTELVRHTFCPFGFGARICIGQKLAMMELKIMVSRLVYRFEVIKTNRTPNEPKYNAKKLDNHCEPIYVKLKRRSPCAD